MAKANPTTYWKGDLAEYTRETMKEHGALWYGLKLLEGHRKGDVVWTYRAPGMNEPADPLDGCPFEAWDLEQAEQAKTGKTLMEVFADEEE